MSFSRPLYLHFLDRELRTSVHASLASINLEKTLMLATLTTNNFLYSNISLVFESNPFFNGTQIDLIQKLCQFDVLRLIAGHGTMSEFLASRQRLYFHDKNRYPLYFDREDAGLVLYDHAEYRETGTTTWLSKKLLAWSDNYDDKNSVLSTINRSVSNYSRSELVKRIISREMRSRGERAITYSLFETSKPQITDAELQFALRRTISVSYTKRYLELYDGDIPTGLRTLQFFDYLSCDYPLYDLEIFSIFFQHIASDLFSSNGLDAIIYLRSQEYYGHFLTKFRSLLRVIYSRVLEEIREDSQIRAILIAKFRQYIQKLTPLSSSTITDYHARELFGLISIWKDRLIRSDRQFAHNSENNDFDNHWSRVLLITATDTETRSLFEISKQFHLSPILGFIGNLSYWSMGLLGGCEILVIQTGMGTTGSSASTLTVNDAVSHLKPDYVIMLGIAFGTRPKDVELIDGKTGKQQIGDILISRQIMFYEPLKINVERVFPRGDRISADPHLLNLFESASISWSKCSIHSGLILSGDKLVNHEGFRNALAHLEPEAIGGEMEGAGLVSACSRNHTPWILIKSICDWAHEKDSSAQLQSANNATAFVLSAIRTGGLSKD